MIKVDSSIMNTSFGPTTVTNNDIRAELVKDEWSLPQLITHIIIFFCRNCT